VTLSDGSVRNGYTIKIVNKTDEIRQVRIKVAGIEGITTSMVGLDGADPVIDVPVADVRAVKLFVTLPRDSRSQLSGSSTPLDITVTDTTSGVNSSRPTSFHGPEAEKHHDDNGKHENGEREKDD
jgi:hypothetical protein